MIDYRNCQMSRALDFLDETLNDRNLCILVGDLDEGFLRIYSNAGLPNYKNTNGIYFKQVKMGRRVAEKLKDHLNCPRHFIFDIKHIDAYGRRFEQTREPTDAEQLFGISQDYAWIPTAELSRLSEFPLHPAYEFPEDFIIAHEGAHNAIGRHWYELSKCQPPCIEEAVVQLLGIKYLEKRYPELVERYWEIFLQSLSPFEEYTHREAYNILRRERFVVEAAIQEIRERNLRTVS